MSDACPAEHAGCFCNAQNFSWRSAATAGVTQAVACAEYVGCFKIRNAVDARLAQRSHRWYDPHHKVFLGDDTRYAEGPFYVIHGRIIEGIMRSGLLPRAGGPEGANPG